MVARNGEEIVNHIALNTVLREFGLVGDLCVILIEVLRKIDDRLLDELKVAYTTHNDTYRYRVVGLYLALVYLRAYIELTHTARKVCRTLRQRVYLDGQSRSLYCALNLDIT